MTMNRILRTVPTYVQEKAVDKEGDFTDGWQQYFSQQQQYIQANVGNQGYRVSWISSDPTSVTPSATGGQVGQLEAAYAQSATVRPGVVQTNLPTLGTVIFDPFETNGGSSSKPNGQLKVLLGDGLFHKITNT